MTDWTDDLARARALRETIEDDPTAVASLMGELLELAHDEEWAGIELYTEKLVKIQLAVQEL